MTAAKRTLSIVGFGIRGFGQLTLEAIEVLEAADKVLYPGGNDRHLRRLQLRGLESFEELYRDGDLDEENYVRIRDKVLAEVRTHERTALLFEGHPRVGVTVTDWLADAAEDEGFALQVLPGISSFDGMMIDLGRDPLRVGTVVVDANRLLLRAYELDPHLDLYIYHVCSVATRRTHLSDPRKSNRIDLLRDRLLKFFPPDHRCTLICSSDAIDGSKLRDFTVGTLVDALDHVHFGTTLFVPAIPSKKVSRSFLAAADPERLRDLEERQRALTPRE